MESTSLTNAKHPIFGNKELFREILKNLNVFEIVRTIGIVCKTWNLASKDFNLLKQIDMPFWIRAKLNPTPKKTIISIETESIYALYKDRVIVADKEGNLTLFTKTGKSLSEKKAHESGITHLKIADGKCLSVSQEAIKVWDLRKENPFNEPLVSLATDKKSHEIVQKVAFNGRHIVTNLEYDVDAFSSSLCMRIWDTQTLTSRSFNNTFFEFSFTGKYGFFRDRWTSKVFAYDLEENSIVLDRTLDSINSHILQVGIYQDKLCIIENERGVSGNIKFYALPKLNLVQEKVLPTVAYWIPYKHFISTVGKTDCTLLNPTSDTSICKMIHLPEGYKIKMDGSNTLIFANEKLYVVSSSSVDFEGSKGLLSLTSSNLKDMKKVKILDGSLYFSNGFSLTILDYKEKAVPNENERGL